MTAVHAHPDPDRLTFGCQACIQRGIDEAWRTAPHRLVRARAEVPTYVVVHADGREIAWEFTARVRVPDGTRLDDPRLLDWVGESAGIGMPALEDLTDDQRFDALATAEVEVLRIDNEPAERAPEPIPAQGALGFWRWGGET